MVFPLLNSQSSPWSQQSDADRIEMCAREDRNEPNRYLGVGQLCQLSKILVIHYTGWDHSSDNWSGSLQSSLLIQ
jgi:hypothetical protein